MDRYSQHRPPRKRTGGEKPPSDRTYHQTGYISQLAKDKTPLVIKLMNDEEIRGYIQYYDRDFIRVTCPAGERLFIFYHDIKYMSEGKG